MAQPPAKKQKTSGPKPIVFTTPGYQPDVCLAVFDQEFHVHSVLLKLHSAFFRKFLDSPDKAPQHRNSGQVLAGNETTPAEASRISMAGYSANFKYCWVTRIDNKDHGSWHSVADSSKNGAPESEAFKGDKIYEISNFETLLNAVYMQPYEIRNSRHLISLTSLADYYCALPVLSRTLNIAFYQSSQFVHGIFRNPFKTFIAAAKLRNALLFRESLIWVAGYWDPRVPPQYMLLTDPKLKKLVRRVSAEVSVKLARAGHCLTEVVGKQSEGRSYTGSHMGKELLKAAAVLYNEHQCVCPPQYFRRIYKTIEPSEDEDVFDLKVALQDLLKNNLVLDRRGYKPGRYEGDYDGVDGADELDSDDIDYMSAQFLCAEIEDEDLPWDITETDW